MSKKKRMRFYDKRRYCPVQDCVAKIDVSCIRERNVCLTLLDNNITETEHSMLYVFDPPKLQDLIKRVRAIC